MIGIYCIRNIETGRCYIGKSIQIQTRFQYHRNGFSQCPSIQATIATHGVNAFAFEVLELCPEPDLNDRERFWIAAFNTFHNGYNETIGGGAGSKVSDATRTKMSQSRLGNQNTKGRSLSPEHRAKISKANKGKGTGENNPMFGKKLTTKHRQTLSKANRKPKSVEHRKKIGDAQRGEKNHRYGKKDSTEIRKKKSESAKRAWAKRKAAEKKKTTLFI